MSARSARRRCDPVSLIKSQVFPIYDEILPIKFADNSLSCLVKQCRICASTAKLVRLLSTVDFAAGSSNCNCGEVIHDNLTVRPGLPDHKWEHHTCVDLRAGVHGSRCRQDYRSGCPCAQVVAERWGSLQNLASTLTQQRSAHGATVFCASRNVLDTSWVALHSPVCTCAALHG